MLLAIFSLLSCGETPTEVVQETVQVGCGMCQFAVDEPKSCYWAATLGDRVVPMTGAALPGQADAHAPDGMCSVTRPAVVSGRLYSEHLVVTDFVLSPYDASNPPPSAHEHVH